MKGHKIDNTPMKEKYYEIKRIVENAVNDGLKLAIKRYSELKEKKFDNLYLPKHENYPSVSFFSSGLPRFSTTPAYFGSKVSYNKILSDSKVDIELKSWKIFIEYFMSNDKLRGYIEWNDWNPPNVKLKHEILTNLIFDSLRDLIDSIIHSSNNLKPNTRIKDEKITKWLNALTETSVNYELIIPIIFYQPDCLKLALTENIRIQKLDNKIQLSRHFKVPESSVVHKDVIGAATHAIIISNVLKNIPNNNQWDKYSIIENKINKDFEVISTVFSTMRLVVGDSLGFCQVLAKPIGFEDDWFAELPSLKVYCYKNYPPEFEKGGWHEKRVISKKQLALIKKYINRNPDNTKIKLAKQKLFDSDLRVNRNDAILDISTGLEILLSDSTENLNYKISLRGAIICKLKKFYDFTPVEVKKGIKTFYNLRSAIIHGNPKLDNYYVIKLDRYQPFDTLWFAKNLLRHLIEFLISNSGFVNVENVDDYLLN